MLDDSAGGGVRLYDSSGHDEVRRGPGTRFDTRAWVPPIDDPESRPLDWNGDSTLLPWADYYQDAGLLVGAAMRFRTYGFRQYPYAHSQTFRLSYATQAGAWRVEYLADFRRRGALEPRGELTVLASGYEVLRFYGLGNATAATAPSDYYRVEQQQYLLAPSLVRSLAGGNVSFGPLARYAWTPTGQNQYIASLQPYGIGAFGQLGAHAGLSFDHRDRPDAARRGAALHGRQRGTPGCQTGEITVPAGLTLEQKKGNRSCGCPFVLKWLVAAYFFTTLIDLITTAVSGTSLKPF